MEFFSSAETDSLAGDMFDQVSSSADPLLTELLNSPEFSEFQAEICYIPIIMPAEMATRYPPRSGVEIKSRIIDVAPQLNYEAFIRGPLERRMELYLDGFYECKAGLKLLGMNDRTLDEFTTLFENAKRSVLLSTSSS